MHGRVLVVAILAVGSGCGGSGPDPGPPGSPDPIFDDANLGVSIVEGWWPGVGDPRAGVSPSFSDSPTFQTEAMRSGACRLLVSDVTYCEGCEGWCVEGTCREWPAGRSAGTITIDGLNVPLSMTWTDGYYAQSPQDPPADLFDPGASITVTAAGDEVAGFSASVTGVDEIEPDLVGACDNELHLTRGEDNAVTWADPVPGARVWLRLPSPNNGHGMPPNAVIECEGPDTGQLVVPAALVDALPALETTDPCDGVGCVGHDCPPSTIARYTRAVTTAGPETVEVRAQWELHFYLFAD